jgi:hypothetical protein
VAVHADLNTYCSYPRLSKWPISSSAIVKECDIMYKRLIRDLILMQTPGIEKHLERILNIVEDIHVHLSAGIRIEDRYTLETESEKMMSLINDESKLILTKSEPIWTLKRLFPAANDKMKSRDFITIAMDMSTLKCTITKKKGLTLYDPVEDDFQKKGMSLVQNITRIFMELGLTEEDMSPENKKGDGSCCIS